MANLFLRNESGSDRDFAGQTVADGETYTMDVWDYDAFSTDETLMADVASGDVVVNDGTVDHDPITGWNLLTGTHVQAEIKQKSDSQGEKVAVHASSKPMVPGKAFYAVWTGAGDDMVTEEISGGELLSITVTGADAEIESQAHFHPNNGQVYLHDGFVKWEDAPVGAEVTVKVSATPTSVVNVGAGNGDLNITDNWITYVGPGNGDHIFGGLPILIPRTYSQDGDWDYDGTNLTPNLGGTGSFKISDIERDVHTFINRMPLIGTSSNYLEINSEESTLVPAGYFLKIITKNANTANWSLAIMMYIYREQTAVP